MKRECFVCFCLSLIILFVIVWVAKTIRSCRQRPALNPDQQHYTFGVTKELYSPRALEHALWTGVCVCVCVTCG